MDTIAEEKTTLPEGYTLSVARMMKVTKLGSNEITQLTAYRGNISEVMRVDDVSAHSLRRYLDLVIREIQRQRERLIAKPAMLIKSPKSIEDLVKNMAFHGMFILTPWNAEQQPNDSGPAKAPKKSKKKQPKKTKSVTPTNGEYHIPF